MYDFQNISHNIGIDMYENVVPPLLSDINILAANVVLHNAWIHHVITHIASYNANINFELKLTLDTKL